MSGTQPDSPAGMHRNGCEGCEHSPDTYPPCWTSEQVSADQARIRQLILGGPFDGDGAETAAGLPAAGRTGVTLPESGSESGQGDSGDLRASLVAVILGLSGDLWHLPTRTDATVMADAILADGWRRVSVDDATVERVAQAMREGDVHPDSVPFLSPWESLQPIVQARFRDMARAAVQALRDGSETCE